MTNTKMPSDHPPGSNCLSSSIEPYPPNPVPLILPNSLSHKQTEAKLTFSILPLAQLNELLDIVDLLRHCVCGTFAVFGWSGCGSAGYVVVVRYVNTIAKLVWVAARREEGKP